MSKRKENIRRYCDIISDLGTILKIKHGQVNHSNVGDILIHTAHRIKRTTWRGDENQSNKKIIDQIKRIAIRSFNNNLHINNEGKK